MKKNTEIPYLRIGTQYYKVVKQPLTHDFVTRLAKWDKTTISDDHSKQYLAEIKRFDGFCTIPEHINYKREHGAFYNLYEPFTHKPIQGDYSNTLFFLKHIFSEQIELGLDYLKILYTYPTQILPILALVSDERKTGKSTFLKWLKFIFEGNMTINTNEDFRSQFNSDWTSKLIIAIDETLLDRKEDSERLKNLSTANNFKVEKKGVDKAEIEFFGKFVMCSNNEDTFIKIDAGEIRYWVRKIPVLKKEDPLFLEKINKEVPAFLYYLQNRNFSTEKKTRMWFTEKQIYTEALGRLKQANKTTLEKELQEGIIEALEDFNLDKIFFSTGELKELAKSRGVTRFMQNDIKKILEEKWELFSRNSSYISYSWLINAKNEPTVWETKKKGRFYTFNKAFFKIKKEEEIKKLKMAILQN